MCSSDLFQSGNLYVAMAGLDGINDFSLAKTLVDNTPYDTKKDGVLRGGSYWFVRWLYDRAGGDTAQPDGSLQGQGGPWLLRRLMAAPDSMAQALPLEVSASWADVAVDFYTTLAASNREDKQLAAAVNPCFRFLPVVLDPVTQKPRGGNVFAKFHGTQMKGPASQKWSKADKKLLAGGADFVLLDASPDAPQLTLVVQVDADALPRLRVVRIR